MQFQIDSLAVAALASANFLRMPRHGERKQRPERNPKKALHQKEFTKNTRPSAGGGGNVSARGTANTGARGNRRIAGGSSATAARKSALTPPKSTVTNAIDDPSVSLQRFDLLDLQRYTQEKVYSTTASKDFHLFYVGRDDVHDILKHVLSRVSVSLYLNMFGFDDNELNDILMKIALDATITMLVTLDKSQANGPHEKALLDADRTAQPRAVQHPLRYQNACAGVRHRPVGHASDQPHQGICGGRPGRRRGINQLVGLWRGYLYPPGKPRRGEIQGAEQHQSIITDPDTVSRFSSELGQHMVAQKQAAAVEPPPTSL